MREPTPRLGRAPDLRAAALAEFAKAWQAWIEDARRLERTSDQLAQAMRSLAEQGSKQTLVMPDELGQRWWVGYQDSRGNFVPPEPDLPPSMPTEDEMFSRSVR